MAEDRTNGFRIRGLNADSDRLAVQSTHQTTRFPFLGRRRRINVGPVGWHDVALAKNEIVVLRPYSASPEIEIEGLGGPYGVLLVRFTQSATFTLRNGQRIRRHLQADESVVVQTENWREPRDGSIAQAQV